MAEENVDPVEQSDGDPFASFGGKAIKPAADPFKEFGGQPVKKKVGTPVVKSILPPSPVGGQNDPNFLGLTNNQQQPLSPFVNPAEGQKLNPHAVAINRAKQNPPKPVTIAPEKKDSSIFDDISEALYIPALNKGFSDLVIKPAAGATDFIDRTLDNMYQAVTGDATPKWLRKKGAFHDLSNWVDKGYEERRKPTNLVSETAEGVVGTLPLMASMFTGQGEATLAAKTPQFISHVTKLLTTTGALNAYKDATDKGEGYVQSLGSAAKGGGEGALTGLTLDAQMLVGGALGKGVANKLAQKGLLKGGKAGEAVLHALSVGSIFGGTAAGEDLLNGRDIDTHNVAKQFGMGLAFEALPVAKALGQEVGEHIEKSDLNKKAAQTASLSSAASNLNAESAVRTLMQTPVDQIKAINENIKDGHEDLYANSIEQGAKAYDEKNLNEKRALYADQLLLKTQADVKLMASKIKANPDEFVNSIQESTELEPQQKQDLLEKVQALTNGETPAVEEAPEAVQTAVDPSLVNSEAADPSLGTEKAPTSTGEVPTSTGEVPADGSEVPTAEKPVVPIIPDYPKPAKEIEDMTSEEIRDHAKEVNIFYKSLDKHFFGEEGAKEYQQAQAVSNSDFSTSEKRKEAYAIIDKYHEQLTPEQSKVFFGEGEGYTDPAELRDLARRVHFIEESENIDDLSSSIKNPLLDFSAGRNRQETQSVLKAAAKKAMELGIDPQDMLRKAVEKIGDDLPGGKGEDLDGDKALLMKSVLDAIAKTAERIPDGQKQISEGTKALPEALVAENATTDPTIEAPIEPTAEVPVTENTTPKATVSFKTSRGSSYVVHENGSTTRDKAERSDPGHEGQKGIQKPSEKTYYISPEDANILGEIQAEHPETRAIKERPDGSIGIQYTTGKDAGKFERRTIVKPELNPKVGLMPLELWKDGEQHHFGNKITEVNQPVEISEAKVSKQEDVAEKFYHATKEDFENFKGLDYGSAGTHNYFYFTKDKNWAVKFGKAERGDKPVVKEVTLDLKKPLDMRELGHGADVSEQQMTKWLQDKGVQVPDDFFPGNRGNGAAWQFFRYDTGKLQKLIKDAGYDGLIFQDNNVNIKKTTDTHVVFDAGQIKKYEASKETPAPEDKTTTLRNSDVEAKRAEYGFQEPVPRKGTTDAEFDAKADEQIKAGVDAHELMDKVLIDKKPITGVESVILSKYQGTKEAELLDVNDKIEKATDSSSTTFSQLVADRDRILEDLQRAYDASEASGTVASDALRARKVRVAQDTSLAGFLVRERMQVNKGEKLSQEQIKAVSEEYKDIQQKNEAYQKKIAELQEQLKTVGAEKILKRVQEEVKLETRRNKRAVKVEQLDKDIEDTFAALKKIAREKRGTLSANPIPVEYLPELAKLVKLYTQKGATTLTGIVDELYHGLKDDIEGLTKDHVLEAISNLPEATKKDPLKAMKSRLKSSIRRVQEKTEAEDFTPTKKNKIVLDEEALKLRDELEKARYEYELRLHRDAYKNRSGKQKVLDIFYEVINTPRALLASTDFSAPLRQGLVPTIAHPILAARAFTNMFKAAFSQNHFDRWFYDLKEAPDYAIIKESKLYVSDPHKSELAAKEEQFMNNLAEKIPFFGKLVRGSERAYVGYLNKLRVDLFRQTTELYESQGKTIANSPELYKGLGKFINNATGRGDFTNENLAQSLNLVLFSPRLIASRLNLLNPVWYSKLPKEVRYQAIGDMAKFIGVGVSLLALAKANGFQVEADPRSADFGKLRSGDKRWDIWGGFSQYVRLFAQELMGQTKSTSTGDITPLGGDKFGARTRLDVAASFMRNKLSPVPAFIANTLAGKDAMGQEFDPIAAIPKSLIPLTLQDTYQAVQKEGLKGMFSTGIPTTFGVGVQTYSDLKPAKEVEPKKTIEVANGSKYQLTEPQLAERKKYNDEWLAKHEGKQRAVYLKAANNDPELKMEIATKSAKYRSMGQDKSYIDAHRQALIDNYVTKKLSAAANKYSKMQMLKKYRGQKGQYNLEKSEE